MKRIIALGATAAVLSGCSGAPVERETATTTTSNPAQAAPVRPTEAKNIVLRGNSTGALPRPYRTVEELAAAPRSRWQYAESSPKPSACMWITSP